MSDKTTLSGGPLGGEQVDQADWPVGETRRFDSEEGAVLYRNEPGDHAIFCGTAAPE